MLRLGVGIRAVFGQRGKDLLLLYSRAKPLGGLTCFEADFQGGSGSCMLQNRKNERMKERKKKKKGVVKDIQK